MLKSDVYGWFEILGCKKKYKKQVRKCRSYDDIWFRKKDVLEERWKGVWRHLEMKSTERNRNLDMVLRRKHIPILTLDERYMELLTEREKPDYIRKMEASVNGWLKKQGQSGSEVKELHRAKTRLMRNIVDNMQETEGESERRRGKKLDKSQKLIREANEKIMQLEEEQKKIPERLEEANLELLYATADICYQKLKEDKEEMDEISRWVTRIRNELKDKLSHRQRIEAEYDRIYGNLHDILGAEIMEYLDEEYDL